MSVDDYGHELPPLLVKLIEEGKWDEYQFLPNIPLNKLLARAGLRPVEGKLAMEIVGLGQGSLVSYTDEQKKAAFESFNLASSHELGHKVVDEGILDIDNTVIIAFDSEKEVIALDYRENSMKPCVRAFIAEEEELLVDWRMIAPDFETFARELGLVEWK